MNCNGRLSDTLRRSADFLGSLLGSLKHLTPGIRWGLFLRMFDSSNGCKLYDLSRGMVRWDLRRDRNAVGPSFLIHGIQEDFELAVIAAFGKRDRFHEIRSSRAVASGLFAALEGLVS
jgi:hypothetical protein